MVTMRVASARALDFCCMARVKLGRAPAVNLGWYGAEAGVEVDSAEEEEEEVEVVVGVV